MYNNFEKPPQYENYDGQPNITLSAPVNITPMQPSLLNYQPPMQPQPQPNVFYQPGQQQQQQQTQIGFVQVQPVQQAPIGVVQVAPVGVGYFQKNYLTWSILNAIFFFPYLLFWIPALICSLSSRSKASLNDMRSARQLASASLALNIVCTVFGIIGYIIMVIVIPVSIINGASSVYSSSISSYSNSYSGCTYSYSLSYYMCSSYKSGCWYSYTYGYYMC